MINFAAIMPHSPNLVPGVGSPEDFGRLEKTVRAMEQLGRELEQARPDVIVVIAPHVPVHPYSFGINKKHHLSGELVGSESSQKFEFRNDTEMAARIIFGCSANNEIPIHPFKGDLNFGMLVPLYYLTRHIKPLVVPVSFSALELHVHYGFGELLGKICREEKKDVAIIASGDLSHQLSGAEFDQKLIKALTRDAVPNLLDWKADLVTEAQECGLRSIAVLLGALKGTKYKFKEYSYEAPLGAGYLTARLL